MEGLLDDRAALGLVNFGRKLRSEVATETAFTTGVESHVGAMLRLARRLGRDHAEDIVQEALTRAWTKRHQFDPDRGSLGAWLLAITADQAYKSWRWNARHVRPVARERKDSLGSDDALDLEKAIGKLPARQRLAVDCFYFAGLSIAETAVVMACSPGTVKSTLAAARSALRGLLR